MIKVSDQAITWYEGMTINDLLNELDDTHPYAVVRINEKYVSRPNFDHTIIPDDSVVFLIPMISGG